MIRKATSLDIETIMRIVEKVKQEMYDVGNHQWDEDYPNAQDFLKDVDNGSLYVYEEEGVLGFVCFDFHAPVEYDALQWQRKDALIMHRMAVDSDSRGRGIAKKLMNYAEDYCKKNGVLSIHTDTYSVNKATNQLLVSMGFEFVGEINLMDRPLVFNCYEKEV